LTHVLLRQKVGDNPTRDKDAIVTLLGVRSDIEQHIVEIQNAKAEYARSLGCSRNGDGLDNADVGASVTTTNSSGQNGNIASRSDDDSTSSDSDGISDTRGTSHLAQNSSRINNGHTARLRDVRTLLHKAHFLLGDAYHRLGCTVDEDSSYSAAEQIRKQLLRSTELRALQTMQLLRDRRGRDLKIRAQFKILPTENPGKETAKLVGTSHQR
jgi:E3 ubiquitin-protein ligase SHPRH